ncbi:MAG: four helix bundle protein [Verrucomicrobiota bacterium]
MKTDDLRARTFQFGMRCIRLAEALPKNSLPGEILARQLIRCDTSVGATYRAAARARSRNDFIAKLGIVEEESDETLYWFDVTAELKLVKQSQLTDIQREANELLAITVSSIKTARTNTKTVPKK